MDNVLEQVRAICLGFPDVTEKLSHGEPTWFVKGKRVFANFANHHHDDRVAIWCAAPAGAQEFLISSDPATFFRPPYVGPRGWIGMYLDREPNWDEVRGILDEAYRTIVAKL